MVAFMPVMMGATVLCGISLTEIDWRPLNSHADGVVFYRLQTGSCDDADDGTPQRAELVIRQAYANSTGQVTEQVNNECMHLWLLNWRERVLSTSDTTSIFGASSTDEYYNKLTW